MLLDILLKLEEMYESGKEVLVRWHFPEDDEDMDSEDYRKKDSRIGFIAIIITLF